MAVRRGHTCNAPSHGSHRSATLACASVGLVGMSALACAAASTESDLCRQLASGDVRVAYERITRVSGSYGTTRCFWGEGEGDRLRSIGGFPGWLESDGLWAQRPEGVIHDYGESNRRPSLLRGWSERNGETICRLYERADGERELLLCRLATSPTRGMLHLVTHASSPGAVVVETGSDPVRVGVQCSAHGDPVLALLLPRELEGCAAEVLTRVVYAADQGTGSLGWCASGEHDVVAPVTGSNVPR